MRREHAHDQLDYLSEKGNAEALDEVENDSHEQDSAMLDEEDLPD